MMRCRRVDIPPIRSSLADEVAQQNSRKIMCKSVIVARAAENGYITVALSMLGKVGILDS